MNNKTVQLSGLLIAVCYLVLVSCSSRTEGNPDNSAAEPYVSAASPIDAGRYLVVVGGCNDCHTARYMETEGDVPEEEWLLGTPIGFMGPWGTTYPSNLRLLVDEMSEDTWVETLHTRKALPPMPWMNVNQLSEQDARALYSYIQSLGPAGEKAPANIPPDQEPETPYILMMPQHMERLQVYQENSDQE